MTFLTILMIAVGLSMDSFSVSISSGIFMRKFRLKEALKIALILALFQGGMTTIGWALGINFSEYIKAVDHWIAFVLLSYLGGKMIFEAFKKREDACDLTSLSNKTIMTLGLATSIDALAVGVGMAFLKSGIIFPSLIIFLTTFLFSICGLYFGTKFGRIKWVNIELIGGLILIGIGVKILLEHTIFA
ncbi:MAG: manganese efflux pump MntP family protein [Bacteroidales bacterium]